MELVRLQTQSRILLLAFPTVQRGNLVTRRWPTAFHWHTSPTLMETRRLRSSTVGLTWCQRATLRTSSSQHNAYKVFGPILPYRDTESRRDLWYGCKILCFAVDDLLSMLNYVYLRLIYTYYAHCTLCCRRGGFLGVCWHVPSGG